MPLPEAREAKYLEVSLFEAIKHIAFSHPHLADIVMKIASNAKEYSQAAPDKLLRDTVLEAISHLSESHLDLAERIETIGAMAQGKGWGRA